MDDNTAHRFYNETEIGTLIQRATELHEEARGASQSSLSLEEIERIAAELGVPSEHVKSAALELEARLNSSRTFSFWGGPFVIDQVRIVDEPMAEEQWEEVVLELRRVTGSTGQTSEFGQVREWTRSTQDLGLVLEKTLVTARSKDGRTSIQVSKHYGGGAVFAYVAAFAVSATAAGIALDGAGLSDLLSFALFSGGGVAGLAAARASISVWAQRQKHRLKNLTDVLYQKLSTASPQPQTSQHIQGQIEMPAMDESEEEVFTAGRRARVGGSEF